MSQAAVVIDFAVPAPDSEARPVAKSYPCTDMGNAERVVACYGRDLRYCAGLGRLVWDGCRWERDDTGEWVRRGKATMRGIWKEAATEQDDDRRKRLGSWAIKSEAAGRIAAALTLAESEPEIAIRATDLDSNPWLFNVTNGTVDLRTGKLATHRRDDLITKLAAVTFDPDADAPTWRAFLERVVPSPAVREFLQRWVGYCLTGSVREQALVFLYGHGANGKSTFINSLLQLVGDYAKQGAPELLMAKVGMMSAGDASAEADLFGARLVMTTEVQAGRAFDEGVIKRLTGGDRIKCKLMRQDWWEFNPTHKFMIAGNHKPNVKGTDHAIWRRLLLVPFTVTIAPGEKDPDLPAKLAAELSGILNWALEGCRAWQESGLAIPDEVRAATREYREGEDLMGSFIADCCALAPKFRTASSDLYRAFTSWCEDQGERAGSQRAMAQALTERGFEPGRNMHGRFWCGIALKPEVEHQQRMASAGAN